ncbi:MULTISPECIES: ABC transporter ATP-binding protein [Streptomyces]|uniref:ABC transporter ATP-binding protein n=5 Tax=Streptomyces TaxID=1883 RepID=A0A8H9HZ74_9ACTN|nr:MULTISPECIES: ABC transporter ATP-binding protein [Streptomyces]NEE25906.1 ABC transporter ATP-binding protein [Streptomyces sp. SID7982]NEE56253.1 ABC transporter ATP-binding protein [Streptomyces sp. SID8455]MBL3806076.1 ABC transporter ATP-binding protein [Streptomyces sp. BRB081]MDQ0294362.1 ABC-2 type transport system ATP-binding protein [Streptomyces sp. DSM 41037]NEC11584.1 ABC transporter ATP-binding protein [Streptomyces sp. SID8014]
MNENTLHDRPGAATEETGTRPVAGPGTRIEVTGLTKRFGEVTAVDGLSFAVEPGVVTGFLGPNGAGKTTTMRMILGLVTPTEGTATVGGRRYTELDRPSDVVGAVLDTSAFHPNHSARDHLRIYCAMGGHPDSRVDELLTRLGIAEHAHRRTRTFSTGMKQRLSLATALLGDPRVLLLDEPSNGLDPEGIAWLRTFLRELAAEGRTVLVSSHVLSEVQQIVDDIVMIRRGRLVAAGPLADIERYRPATVLVRSPDAERLRTLILDGTRGPAAEVVTADDGSLRVRGLTAAEIADLASAAGLRVHELSAGSTSLEQLFLDLTQDSTEQPEQNRRDEGEAR